MRAHYVQAKLRLDVLATLPYEALAPIGFATTSDTKTILLAVALLRLPRLLRCSRCLEHFRVAFGWLPPQLCLSKAQSRMLLVWSLCKLGAAARSQHLHEFRLALPASNERQAEVRQGRQ
jgi:hypothetical protein